MIGISAFALAGFLVGVRKELDILGICIAAFLTALGGGIIRDTIVQRTPFAFSETYPFICIVAMIALALLLRVHKRQGFDRSRLFVVADSIGLVAFSMTGALIAIDSNLNFFGVIFLAFLTAVGGGIVRDTLVNEIPFVLNADFYGSVAIVTGILVYGVDMLGVLNHTVLLIIGVLSLMLRLVAYFRGWTLPRLVKGNENAG
nr:trimeric intracellular cation channel family protein [Desulfurispira natronophila]